MECGETYSDHDETVRLGEALRREFERRSRLIASSAATLDSCSIQPSVIRGSSDWWFREIGAFVHDPRFNTVPEELKRATKARSEPETSTTVARYEQRFHA